MFGYVRPCRPELRCWELDLYKATYCGLCCTLRTRYGLLAPMFLSYDMTFLALLLEESETQISYCKGACHANLMMRKKRVKPSESLNLCADYTVILTWFQLKDSIADDGFFKKIGASFLRGLLYPSYKKALALHPQFSDRTQQALEKLSQLEKECCGSMDQVADCFAIILKETVPKTLDEMSYRSLQQLLYHVGRWIYLIDARDDFEKDKEKENYNPLSYRYGEVVDQQALNLTLEQSLSLARSALVFVDFGIRTGTIDNILSMGLPIIQKSVLNDTWNQRRKKIWRKNDE